MHTGRLLCALVATVVGAAYLSAVRWWLLPISIGVLAWFVLHGVALMRRATHSHGANAHWLFGPVLGVGLCTVGLLGVWVCGGRGAWIFALAPWPTWVLLILPIGHLGELALPRFTRRDALAAVLLLLLVPVVAGLPYARVGEPVEDGGKAYRAYFTADFVWAMTVVAEVSKGEMPPVNPFLSGGTLHYYWLAHFLSAAEYRALRPFGVAIEEVILANSLGYGLAFVAFLYGFIRAFGAGVWASAGACAMVFLANSFEALERIWAWWPRGQIWERLKNVNIDAGTRWFHQGMPVDGLQRLLLYQPHHLTGYALGLLALLLVARAREVARPALALTAGSLLGLSLLFSSFGAIIIGVAVAIVYAARLLARRHWRMMPVCALLGAIPVAVAVLASSALGYVDASAGPLIQLGPNPVALVRWPFQLALSFGPLLVLGAIGLIVAVATRQWGTLPAAALAAVALTFYFMVDVPDMMHVWVGWRAGHMLYFALTVFAGILFTSLRSLPMAASLGAWSAVGLLAAAALPTVAVDIFNAQDITNRNPGAGFPWTLVLTRSEVEALDWVKASTPSNAIVQPDAQTRGTTSWTYIPAFAERRMAAGLPGAMIPFKPYKDATAVVAGEIFGTGDPHQRFVAARRLGIDYLFVGPTEQQAHPQLVALLDTRPDLFGVAFRNAGVVIYRVKKLSYR